MRILICAAAAALTLSTAAFAADDFIRGIYLESDKVCEQAKKESLEKVAEEGNLILSDRGFDTNEYNCAFVQVSKHPRQEKAWLVSAICEEPGLMSPDIFSIVERQAGQLEVASMEDGDDGEEDGLSGTYHLCEGVKLP
jgi:hypothetical protein